MYSRAGVRSTYPASLLTMLGNVAISVNSYMSAAGGCWDFQWRFPAVRLGLVLCYARVLQPRKSSCKRFSVLPWYWYRGRRLPAGSGRSNYAECVLKNIKGVSGDMAANAVRMACNRQFPIPNVLPAPNPLPDNPTAADIQAYVVQRNACIQADTERKVSMGKPWRLQYSVQLRRKAAEKLTAP